jgi:hypothetical protein
MRGHADRNASLKIGQRLINRYQKLVQEKPQARRVRSGRVVKAAGVIVSQDAQREQRPSISLSQGMETVTSMAPLKRERSGWMNAPHLYLLNYGFSMSSLYETQTRSADYRGVKEAAGLLPLRSVTSILAWLQYVCIVQIFLRVRVNFWQASHT